MLVPYFSSISLSIFGTSTAGDTAATTEPIKAASNKLISKSFGAIKIIPIISKLAGTKHINIAGRPTFFKSSISRLSPALVNIMMRANSLKSADIESIELSNKFKQYGPNTIPVIISPKSDGSFKSENIFPSIIPHKNINAKLRSIKLNPF